MRGGWSARRKDPGAATRGRARAGATGGASGRDCRARGPADAGARGRGRGREGVASGSRGCRDVPARARARAHATSGTPQRPWSGSGGARAPAVARWGAEPPLRGGPRGSRPPRWPRWRSRCLPGCHAVPPSSSDCTVTMAPSRFKRGRGGLLASPALPQKRPPPRPVHPRRLRRLHEVEQHLDEAPGVVTMGEVSRTREDREPTARNHLVRRTGVVRHAAVRDVARASRGPPPPGTDGRQRSPAGRPRR